MLHPGPGLFDTGHRVYVLMPICGQGLINKSMWRAGNNADLTHVSVHNKMEFNNAVHK